MQAVRIAYSPVVVHNDKKKHLPRDPRANSAADKNDSFATRVSNVFPSPSTWPSQQQRRAQSQSLPSPTSPTRSAASRIKRKPVPSIDSVVDDDLLIISNPTSPASTSVKALKKTAPPRPLRIHPVRHSSTSSSSTSSSSLEPTWTDERRIVFPTHAPSTMLPALDFGPDLNHKIDLQNDVNERKRLEAERREREREEAEAREVERREREQVEAIRLKRQQAKAASAKAKRTAPAIKDESALASMWRQSYNTTPESANVRMSPVLLQAPTHEQQDPLTISIAALVPVPTGGLQIVMPDDGLAVTDDAASDLFFDAQSTLSLTDEDGDLTSSPVPSSGDSSDDRLPDLLPSLSTRLGTPKRTSSLRIVVPPSRSANNVFDKLKPGKKATSVDHRRTSSSESSDDSLTTPPPSTRSFARFAFPPTSAGQTTKKATTRLAKAASRY